MNGTGKWVWPSKYYGYELNSTTGAVSYRSNSYAPEEYPDYVAGSGYIGKGCYLIEKGNLYIISVSASASSSTYTVTKRLHIIEWVPSSPYAGTLIKYLCASDSDYPDGGVSDSSWYKIETTLPKYWVLQCNNDIVQSRYNTEDKLLLSRKIELNGTSSVNIKVGASNTAYSFYVSSDESNWTKLDNGKLDGIVKIALSNSNKLYFKIECGTSTINSVKVSAID